MYSNYIILSLLKILKYVFYQKKTTPKSSVSHPISSIPLSSANLNNAYFSWAVACYTILVMDEVQAPIPSELYIIGPRVASPPPLYEEIKQTCCKCISAVKQRENIDRHDSRIQLHCKCPVQEEHIKSII